MKTHEDRVTTKTRSSARRSGLLVKLGLVALFDGLVVSALPVLFAAESWLLVAVVGVVGAIINWAYLSPRARAVKWLAPGLIFMGMFVMWPIGYTVYVSLTNWATGNSLSMDQVIEQLERVPMESDGDPVSLALSVYGNDQGELAFLLSDPEGERFFGVPRPRGEEPVENPLLDLEALGADFSAGLPESIGDYRLLGLRDVFAIASDLEGLELDIPGRGVARPQTTSQAQLMTAGHRYTYDPVDGTLFDFQENLVCTAQVGNFVCPGGRRLDPGWRVVLGMDNYRQVLANPQIRVPILGVFTWNVAFAGLSVVLTFALGLALANALQDDRLRGKAAYRSIFILPYAIPGFLSIIIWRGLLNNQYGQVNDFLGMFGIDQIPWLLDGTWAKVALLMVNAWLGFPYMFLVTSGALQAVPAEMKEAARVDGAGPWRVFRTVTLPLLLVSTAPLLIGSFAFNFNNFVLIFLLTNGGPPIPNSAVPVGETDLLITFTYDLALRAGRGNNFALGSAIVIVIFVLLATISAISFRATRRLEEVYGSL